MKKWYYKLKGCQNYNVLILAVLMALVIKFLHYIYVTAVNVYQVVAWDMLDVYGFAMIGSTALTVLFIALAMAFVIQACKRDPKFMICAIVSLAVVAVAGVSLCAVQCIIACGYWLWMVKAKPDKLQRNMIKRVTLILIAVSVMLFVIGTVTWWIPNGFSPLSEEILYVLQKLQYRCLNPEVLLVAYLFKHSENKVFRNLCKVLAVIWVLVTLMMILDTYILSWFGTGHWEEWGPETSVEAGDWSEWSTEEDRVYYDGEGNGVTYESFEFE